MRFGWKTIWAGALAGVAAIALTACGAYPGTVAVVDGHPITEKQLVALAQTKFAQGKPTTTLVTQLIQNELVRPLLESYDALTPPKEQAEQLRSELKLGADYQIEPGLLAAFNGILVKPGTKDETIKQIITELRETLGRTDVQLNPRYGTYSPKTVVAEIARPWLASKSRK